MKFWNFFETYFSGLFVCNALRRWCRHPLPLDFANHCHHQEIIWATNKSWQRTIVSKQLGRCRQADPQNRRIPPRNIPGQWALRHLSLYRVRKRKPCKPPAGQMDLMPANLHRAQNLQVPHPHLQALVRLARPGQGSRRAQRPGRSSSSS